MGKSSRRSFLVTSAGVAAGAAATAVPGVAAAADSEPAPLPVQPNGPPDREPVMAYVRDADAGEVTVMSGTGEVTYRDRALVKRLLDAAPDAEERG